MSGSYLFTEQGRVKRADKKIYMYFSLGALLLAFAVGCLAFNFFVYKKLTPLQRHYFGQFTRSAVSDAINPFREGRYSLIVRSLTDQKVKRPQVFLCREEQMVENLDKNGDLKYDKNGIPAVNLKSEIPVDKNGFTIFREKIAHKIVYEQLSKNVFENCDYHEYFQVPAASAFGAFFFSLVGFGLWRNRTNKKWLEGKHLRGTRKLSTKEYAKQMKKSDGIGIAVLPQ
jgi:hypothetical protein